MDLDGPNTLVLTTLVIMLPSMIGVMTLTSTKTSQRTSEVKAKFRVIEWGKERNDTYVTPFEGRDDWSKHWNSDPSHLYSLDLVLKPENHKVTGYLHNPRRVPKWNYVNTSI